MSIGCESGYSEFYCERCYRRMSDVVRNRYCNETGFPIHMGERYVYISGKYDGEFWTFKQSLKAYHLCRALHEKWADENGYKECVIAFAGLQEVDEEDLPYFGIKTNEGDDAVFLRALRWAKSIGEVIDLTYDITESKKVIVGEITDADWEVIERYSLVYSSNDVGYGVFGQKIIKEDK